MTPRDAYRAECNAIALADPRWSQGDGDDCVACSAWTRWLDPKGTIRCPSCWPWLTDPDADSVPSLKAPLQKLANNQKLPCRNCDAKEYPVYDWRWVGKTVKKLALQASCALCKRYIKWMDIRQYEFYAPPRPPVRLETNDVWTLFELEKEHEHLTYLDLEETQRKSKAAAPKAPWNAAIEPLDRVRMCAELYFGKTYDKAVMLPAAERRILARLYLDKDGFLCCTKPWTNVPDVRLCAAKIVKVIKEDFFFQLRALEVSPHVMHLAPQDTWRAALLDCWKTGDKATMARFEESTSYFHEGPPGLALDEVIEMEVDALGVSLTERKLSRSAKPFYTHDECKPVFISRGMF